MAFFFVALFWSQLFFMYFGYESNKTLLGSFQASRRRTGDGDGVTPRSDEANT